MTSSPVASNPAGEEPAIEVDSLVKAYPENVLALNGLSFSVETGTIFGLLGPNGAGKSTTVKILTTLSRPDSGHARIMGMNVTQHPNEVRKIIGGVAQQSTVDREATGRENLVLQGQLYGMNGSELEQRADELLKRFGLYDAAGRITRTYSGGMQRKLDVAMGLVHRPQVLFLDEPTTGLDPKARADLWEEIEKLVEVEQITILLTTHYLEEADRLAQRLAIVDQGKVVVEGTPENLKSELRGDAIHVELVEDEEEPKLRELLQRLDGIHDIIVEEQLLHARVDRGAKAVPAVLAALESENIKVVSATMARPSLDDVYLRYTGHAFHQSEDEETIK